MNFENSKYIYDVVSLSIPIDVVEIESWAHKAY